MARTLRRVAIGFFVLVLCPALALVLGAAVPRPLFASGPPGTPARSVLLLNNPIHTDFAIPIDADVRARFSGLVDAGLRADLPAARYIVFGWGGRDFYINTPPWSQLRAGPLMKGLTLDRSVMNVDLAGAFREPQPQLRRVWLSEAGYARLLDFIAASFTEGPGGPIRIPDAGYGEFDAFFEANGSFNALAGCNTWTSAGLRAAGLRTGWWNPLPQSLNLSLDAWNAQLPGVQP